MSNLLYWYKTNSVKKRLAMPEMKPFENNSLLFVRKSSNSKERKIFVMRVKFKEFSFFII